jgi:pyruvate,orthophosphate dikinase
VILVRIETSPEDIKGMKAAQGILKPPGRHDQPRGVGGPADGPRVRRRLRRAGYRLQKGHDEVGGKTFKEGDFISLDGSAAKCSPARSTCRRRK